jgi:sugar phosphate isomerase/epimerase
MIEFALCGNAQESVPEGFALIELWAATTFAADAPAPNLTLPCRSTNGFFSGNFSIYDDEDRAIQYGISLAKRASEYGIKLMVVGSGAARQAFGSLSPDDALDRFIRILTLIQSEVPSVMIAPEPLNIKECNVGCDYQRLAERCKVAGLGICIDTYHVFCETPEPVRWNEVIHFTPDHVHIANRERQTPTVDDLELRRFFSRLRELDYSGIVSYEGSRPADPLPLKILAEQGGYS